MLRVRAGSVLIICAVMRHRLIVLLVAALAGTTAGAFDADQSAADAKQRWAESPHGPMLERILPPNCTPLELPDPESRGARLTVQYCVQCHHLPNPAMHNREKWPVIYQRMVLRMEGNGNLGKLMREMMAGVQAPSAEESRVLLDYLQENAQRALDPRRYPDIGDPSAQSFRLACQQCHALPDPQRYTAREWPAVVARMERNMAWMNRVVGTKPVPGELQLRTEEIVAYLQKHARKS